MIHPITLFVCLFSAAAFAQSPSDQPDGAVAHQMMHETMHQHHAGDALPSRTGQSAFAAIQEIVDILEADPSTDWSKVNIDALREHLIDMNNVALAADVKAEEMDGGMRFMVTGAGPLKDSIRRMVMAHARAMNDVDGWGYEASEMENGATLIVRAPPAAAAKLRGLGFMGIMTRGMHHQIHHLMIARGESPHH
jgi:hypothetical protein